MCELQKGFRELVGARYHPLSSIMFSDIHRSILMFPSKRSWLASLSATCVFVYVLAMSVPKENVYVLGPGFPLDRTVASSGTYKPRPGSRLFPPLQLNTTVPWPMTRQWEPVQTTSSNEGRASLHPQCAKLIASDDAEQAYAQRFMADNSPVTRSDADYIRDTRDCARFVRERGYILDASEKEKDFPIAYSVLFYKDLEMAERLLRAIYRPHNVYCLHLDKKSASSTWTAARGLASCLKNVFLASRPISVEWGTYTVLEPEIVCMQDLWHNKAWRYFINLTGQEFPLKTNLQLVEILSALNGSNDVDCTTNEVSKGRWYNSFTAPHGIQPMKGNLHITASRGFVDFVLHSDVARDFLRWVSFTEVPDETFFASLNHNPHLRVPGSYLGPPDTDAVLKPYLSRYKNWGHNWLDKDYRTNFNWPCHGKRVRDICIFGVGDLPSLTSRKELFANKFHLDFEPLTLDCLEEWLWNMTMDEYSERARFDVSFYQQLDSVRNHVVNHEYG